ncbi:MAG: hypothetical protein MnENMB40S_04110 [Rhizobiaceae bacterium MnEN-MB40S]|nr:MAG: hypothetical protein MnENMB40S_04110 [Rhizobiaceae bacterium MnEN-MB40S]
MKPIYLPVICGPTSGNSFSEELWEWARQARRWSIGAFETFHYVISERRNLGYLSTLRLGATIVVLYGLFQTIMFASTLVASPIWQYTQWQAGADHVIWYAVSIIPWLFIAGASSWTLYSFGISRQRTERSAWREICCIFSLRRLCCWATIPFHSPRSIS